MEWFCDFNAADATADQDTTGSQLGLFTPSPVREIPIWELSYPKYTTLTNNGLAGSMMPDPAQGTIEPVIDLTSTTPDPPQNPSRSSLGNFQSNQALYSQSTSSHLPRQGEGTLTTIMEDNRLSGLQRSTASPSGTDSPLSNDPPSTRLYKCEWQGCHTPGLFHREGDLVRHIRSIHISPDKYPCDDCGKTFGRKEHLKAHRKRHQESKRTFANA